MHLAGLDKVCKGHMLADVVAIIGEYEFSHFYEIDWFTNVFKFMDVSTPGTW